MVNPAAPSSPPVSEELRSLSDSELMVRVQSGSSGAFDEIVVRYRATLIRVARGKLRDAELAEDAVQECLLAVFTYQDSFQSERPFRTWLWTILLNLCRRQQQRLRRSESIRSRLIGWGVRVFCLGRAEEDSKVDSNLAEADRTAYLDTLLSALNETQADALRLRFLAEMSYAEIATTMGCSLNTAKWRVKKGLSTLSEHVQSDERAGHEL